MATSLAPAQFPFLDAVSAAARAELRGFRPTRVVGRQLLLSRGDPVEGAFLVVGGTLRIYYLTPAGREATLYHVEPGSTCVLALTATWNRAPYPAWVETGPRGATFVQVPGAPYRRLFDAEPAFRGFLFGVVSARLFELMRALEELGSLPVAQRLARVLLRRATPAGVVAVTQASLAAELGTAREVVFRALRELVAAGAIRCGRGRIELVDLAALARRA